MSPRVVAIVQARMGSTRLPGKTLAPLAGRPLLWHVLHRLRKAQTLDAICVATSTQPADDAVAAFAAREGVAVVRGPEDDVLARFSQAAEAMHADVIVRVNADAPFIDGAFVDLLVRAMLAEDADFVMLKPGTPCIHDGVDPISRRALDKLMAEAHDDPLAREHVTGYLKIHPAYVRTAFIDLEPHWRFSGARLSVDTPADVTFVETVYARLQAQAGEASLADLKALLTRDPALLAINGHVRQKAAGSGGRAILRCDGGGVLGFGHVRRMLALAAALRDGQGYGVRFAIRPHPKAEAMVRAAGFAFASPLDGEGEDSWALRLAHEAPDLLAFDVRSDLSAAALLRARALGPLVAVIDDGSERRRAADLAFYPPVPQTRALDWSGASTDVRTGFDWVLLGAPPQPALPASGGPLRVLVTMGGSDPHGFTRKAAQALAPLSGALSVTVVIGAGFADQAALTEELFGLSPDFAVALHPADLRLLIADADLAVAAFGVTAYELAAAGVPAIYLCHDADAALSASELDRAGIGVSLGLGQRATAEHIARAVQGLASDPAVRRDMSAAGRQAVDGRGAQRIAATLAEAVQARRGTIASRAAG